MQGDGLALVPQGGDHQFGDPFRASLKAVQPFDVGHGAEVGAGETDVDERQGQARLAVKDTAGDRGLAPHGQGQQQGKARGQKLGHQRARRLSWRRAIQMPNSYNSNTGSDTKIWLVTSGGVITADKAKMPTKAWRR